jgi:hypothetical protein
MLYLIFIPLIVIVFGYRLSSLRRAIIVSNTSKIKAEILMLFAALCVVVILFFMIDSI